MTQPDREDHVFYRDVGRRYPVATRGEGVYLFDGGGNRYLDGSSGAVVASIGHARPEIADAAARAIRTLSFAHASQFTTPFQERLASQLAALAPPGLDRVYLVSGGSEAVETAIKMAHQYHARRGHARKTRIVSRIPSYHGNTLGALSVSGHLGRRRESETLLSDIGIPVEAPPCEQCQYVPSCDACISAWIGAIDDVIVRTDPATISAFIVEPVVGAACAAYVSSQPFMRDMRALCNRYDMLFIADEVMSGIGRCGYDFAIGHYEIVPDLITVAKGLASGYTPLGAVIAAHDVFETFVDSRTFEHGFTYGGSPVSAAIGSAVLDVYEREALCDRARSAGAILHARLDKLAQRHPCIGQVRGLGLMLGIELVEDRERGTSFPAARRAAKRLVEIAFANGLILYPAGGAASTHRDQVMVAPPLIIAETEIDELTERLDAALTTFESSLPTAT